MQKQMRVPMTNGCELVIDVYGAEADCCNDEISISIMAEDGCYMQDIAIVRESLEQEKTVEALIFADENNEDYTHKFYIKQYEED